VASLQPEPLLVVVLGPTASGKTALSLALAERFHGEIVNCDSVAMYREFDIGTAKPTASERARVPHHLLDCVAPTSHITAGEYARQAREVLDEIKGADICLSSWAEPDSTCVLCSKGSFPDRSARKNCARDCASGPPAAAAIIFIAFCAGSIRAAAEKIHANDTPKLIRAIEVCLASRQKMTDLWQQQGRDPLARISHSSSRSRSRSPRSL
jgi:tRNA dimethylallyltransferase